MTEDDQLPQTQTAIIGLYDILGYQSFMENTDDASLESVAAVVVKYVSMNDRIPKGIRTQQNQRRIPCGFPSPA